MRHHKIVSATSTLNCQIRVQFASNIGDFLAKIKLDPITNKPITHPVVLLKELMVKPKNAPNRLKLIVGQTVDQSCACKAKVVRNYLAERVLEIIEKIPNGPSLEELSPLFEALQGPVLKVLYSDPAIVYDPKTDTISGKTYERSEIEKWWSRHNNDPLTNIERSNKAQLAPNRWIYKIKFKIVSEIEALFLTAQHLEKGNQNQNALETYKVAFELIERVGYAPSNEKEKEYIEKMEKKMNTVKQRMDNRN